MFWKIILVFVVVVVAIFVYLVLSLTVFDIKDEIEDAKRIK